MKKNSFFWLFLVLPSLLWGQVICVNQTEEVSPYIFSHNLEHTRAAVNGGLSAQMLCNRKFAGKPSRNRGVSAHWFGIGEKVYFDHSGPYTQHICLQKMKRWNELNAQRMQNLVEGQTAGLGQYGLVLQKGVVYDLRAVTRVLEPLAVKVELTDRSGTQVYASHQLSLHPTEGWETNAFELTSSASDADACIRYTYQKKAELAFGALSMMPHDNFHGMRRDVVENLKAIGPRMIRWPGGNFAGEYRWKDGLLPVDQRGPLEAFTEIETQPYTEGYDYHEINTDDFIALCREVGAEPFLTINAVWNTPEESAQWVEYCNGSADTEYGRMRAERGHKEPYNVQFWSLGNEMGYGHMEGPKTPEGYASMAGTHAKVMLQVSPDLKIFSSGPYPNDQWAEKSAAALSDCARYVSLHQYNWSCQHKYLNPEELKVTYQQFISGIEFFRDTAHRMRECLDKTGKDLLISFDEWNQWYAWYRPSNVAEGIATARMIHFALQESNALKMPVMSYFQPVGEGAILITPTESRLTANGQMFELMKIHQDALVCHIEDNDDFSTAASFKDGVLNITLINEKYDESRDFELALKGKLLESVLYTSDDLTPYSYFTKVPLEAKVSRRKVQVTLPPHSVAYLRLK